MSVRDIPLTAESYAAVNRTPPPHGRLLKFLNSNEESDLPESWEVRWLAGEVLRERGHRLIMPERKR